MRARSESLLSLTDDDHDDTLVGCSSTTRDDNNGSVKTIPSIADTKTSSCGDKAIRSSTPITKNTEKEDMDEAINVRKVSATIEWEDDFGMYCTVILRVGIYRCWMMVHRYPPSFISGT